MHDPYLKLAYESGAWSRFSNLARLKVVFEHGGIYLDTDVYCLQSLTPLLNNKCFFGFQLKDHPTDWVNNAVFGAVKEHWFIKKAIDAYHMSLKGEVTFINRTSPDCITELLKQEGLRNYSDNGVWVRDVFIYPVEHFYPYAWYEKFSPDGITTNTYAVHLWEKNWDEKDDVQRGLTALNNYHVFRYFKNKKLALHHLNRLDNIVKTSYCLMRRGKWKEAFKLLEIVRNKPKIITEIQSWS